MSTNKIIIGSKECPKLKVIKCLESSSSFSQFHTKWSEIAVELETDRKTSLKLRQNYLLNIIELINVIEELIEEWSARERENATLQELIRVLEKAGLKDCAGPLEKEFLRPPPSTQSTSEISKAGSSSNKQTEEASTSFTSPSDPKLTLDPGTLAELLQCFNSEDVVDGPEYIDFIEVIKTGEPLKVQVDRSLGASNFQIDADSSYYLDPGQTRQALLINIRDHLNPIKGTTEHREGSKHDDKYLTNLLKQLHFEIHPKPEERLKGIKTKKDVKALLVAFRDHCNKVSPSVAFVFIGSHGLHPNKIFTSDLCRLDLHQDIVKEFYHQNCPGLKGKPKVFLVQACQEFDPNYKDGHELHVRDALICTATMPGEVAWRSKLVGSWLVLCFTYVMMKHAKDQPLQEILKKVKALLEKVMVIIGKEQVPVITDLAFDKNLFL